MNIYEALTMCWALESGRRDAVLNKKGKLAFSRGQTAAYKCSRGHRWGPATTRVWDRPPRRPRWRSQALCTENEAEGREARRLHPPGGCHHPRAPRRVLGATGCPPVPSEGMISGHFVSRETKQRWGERVAHFLLTLFLLF